MCSWLMCARTKAFFLFFSDYFKPRNQNLTCTFVCSSAGSSRHHVITQNEAVNSELLGQRKKKLSFFLLPSSSSEALCHSQVLFWAVCDGASPDGIIKEKTCCILIKRHPLVCYERLIRVCHLAGSDFNGVSVSLVMPQRAHFLALCWSYSLKSDTGRRTASCSFIDGTSTPVAVCRNTVHLYSQEFFCSCWNMSSGSGRNKGTTVFDAVA